MFSDFPSKRGMETVVPRTASVSLISRLNVEVARGASEGTRFAFSGQAQFFPGGHPLRNLYGKAFGSSLVLEVDRLFRSEGHFPDGQGHFIDQVRPLGLGLRLSTASERRSAERKPGPSPAAAENVAADAEFSQYVRKVKAAEDVFLAVSLPEPGTAELIVLFSFFGIAEHRIGFADLLELFLRTFVALGMVRMVFHGQLAVSLLDIACGGVLVDPEHFVVVLVGHNSFAFLPAAPPERTGKRIPRSLSERSEDPVRRRGCRAC
jgi:hypothetical protein